MAFLLLNSKRLDSTINEFSFNRYALFNTKVITIHPMTMIFDNIFKFKRVFKRMQKENQVL